MSITGVTTSNDDVKLTADGNLTLEEAANLGDGDLLLDVDGDVSQLAAGTIDAAGLGLMVEGETVLNAANDIDVLAANNNGATQVNDINDLKVGQVTIEAVSADQAMTAMNGTVDAAAMSITGVTTSNDDVKLTADGNLMFEEATNLGGGDLFLDVDGDVTQLAAGTIDVGGLGLMVEGSTILLESNDVNVIAAGTPADVTGQLLFRDINALEVGEVTVAGMTVTGINNEFGDTFDDPFFTNTIATLDNTIQVDADQQFNPEFDGFLQDLNQANTGTATNVGVGLIAGDGSFGTLTVTESINSGSDIVLLTDDGGNIEINSIVQTDLNGNVLVVAADEANISNTGSIQRGAPGLVLNATVLNADAFDLVLDPNALDDDNAFVDPDTFTQDFEFIFGENPEQEFTTTVFFGVELEQFDFGSFSGGESLFAISSNEGPGNTTGGTPLFALTPDVVEDLTQILFEGDNPQFESRSIFESLDAGVLTTQTSQAIGTTIDIGEMNTPAIPGASFSFDFLNLNPEFRNVAFVFNDSNINLFENASDPDNLRDLNVAVESFEGVAVIGRSGVVADQVEEIDVPEPIEFVAAIETEPFQSTLAIEQPLLVQNVQQTTFIVVYFESRAEAELFESSFEELAGESGDVDYDALEKKFEEIFEQKVQFENIDDAQEAFDANQIREIFESADLDLDGDDDQWDEAFREWLQTGNRDDDLPEVPRGLFKIIEVENGKAIIRGDDIDRRFVPEPDSDSAAEDYPFVEPNENEGEKEGVLEINRPETSSTDSDSAITERLARWNRILDGESSREPINETPLVAASSSLALMALAYQSKKEHDSSSNELELLADAKRKQPERNLFSRASRFTRRQQKRFDR